MYLTNLYGLTIASREEVKMCWLNVWTSCQIIMGNRAYSKFGQTMYDDRLLFPALLLYCIVLYSGCEAEKIVVMWMLQVNDFRLK